MARSSHDVQEINGAVGARLLQRGSCEVSPFLIYALVDPRTGERFYVGQSSRGLERCKEHFTPFARKEQTLKGLAVRRIFDAGLVPGVEVLQHIADPDEAVPPLLKHYDPAIEWGALDAAEMRWIAHGRAAGWPLTNGTDGGDGLRGLVRTPEHGAKISASKMGKSVGKGIPKSEEHRAALCVPKKTRTPDHAAKIGAANRGKPKHSEAYKQMLRERMLGAGNPTRGLKASPELRAKLSAAHIGVQAGEKNPNYGKTMSAEQKAKISATKRANPSRITDETRAKLSEAMRQRHRNMAEGSNRPFLGKHHTDESKNRISTTKREQAVAKRLALSLAGKK